jgi:hypothetical protein
VVGDALALGRCRFAGANVEAAVKLRGIASDDFTVELMR